MCAPLLIFRLPGDRQRTAKGCTAPSGRRTTELLTLRGWNVTRSSVGAGTEKVLFGLLQKILARFRVGEAEAVFVHQHFLVLEPAFPRFLGNVLEDALAQVTRKRGGIQPRAPPAQFHAPPCSFPVFFISTSLCLFPSIC